MGQMENGGDDMFKQRTYSWTWTHNATTATATYFYLSWWSRQRKALLTLHDIMACFAAAHWWLQVQMRRMAVVAGVGLAL